MQAVNPIIWMDLPDPDVIRVDDTYYMITTTMHLFPGGMILRSYDLVHWEVASYLYDILEDSPAARLEDGKGIYSAGMWAGSLRYHKGKFYVMFVSNDTREQNISFLFTSDSIEGPWKKKKVRGFYHDCSLLFDDDRVFVAYGNGDIWLTELDTDLSGPKAGGIHKLVIADHDYDMLRYEGCHFYKIRDKYYMFFIHWPGYGKKRRIQSCFVADRVDGPYRGGIVLNDDMDYHNAGVAQGGLVDTPEGKWYAMLFQDHGAVGRIPVLVPVEWDGDWPIFGKNDKVPRELSLAPGKVDNVYQPLTENDSFDDGVNRLKSVWQWNHIPSETAWSKTERPGWLRLKTERVVPNVVTAPNSLGQHTFGPACEASVLLDGTGMKVGDKAGLCVMQADYAWIGLSREKDGLHLQVVERSEEAKKDPALPGRILEDYIMDRSVVRIAAFCRFDNNRDLSFFGFEKDGKLQWCNITHKLHYDLQHFMGARFEMFCYATEEAGGHADFDDFRIRATDPEERE